MKKYFAIIALFMLGGSIYSQNSLKSEPLKEWQPSIQKEYEVITTSKDIVVNLSDEDLLNIQKNRKEDIITFLDINEYVRVKIYPVKATKSIKLNKK